MTKNISDNQCNILNIFIYLQRQTKQVKVKTEDYEIRRFSEIESGL